MAENQTHDAGRKRGEMSLARKVGRMGMLIHRYYEAKAQRHGSMGDPLRGQGRILALLAAKPVTTQRELSYLLDMRQQSLSELLAKLEEKGFVTREKSEEDGRVTVVRLTEDGAKAAPSPDQMRERADALECLDDDERAQLEQLTDKVTSSLEGKLEEMGIDPHQGPRPPRDGRRHGRPHDDRWHEDDQRGQRGPRGNGRGPRDERGGRNNGMRRGPYRPEGEGGNRTWQA